MPTLICVPIMVRNEAAAMADVVAARDAGAELVEFRVDELFSGARNAAGGREFDEHEVGTILRLVARSALPCIVTCRAASEGGHYDGDEMARVALYERLGTAGAGEKNPTRSVGVPGEHPPRYLDIEMAAYRSSANLRQKVHLAVDWPAERRGAEGVGGEGRPGLILSMHDFNGRPVDLLRRIAAMRDEGAARVVKVAYTARSLRDNLELFDLLSENASGKPTIALGMGRFGLMSRVLAPKFGGFLTFASLRPASATAPGQPTVHELLDLYRFRRINPRTRVYGVVGWPVEHSLSPLIHNAGFEAMETDDWEKECPAGSERSAAHDAVYLPLPVPPEYEHFKATLSALIDHPKLDFGGCSVTIPHKQHLVRLARERAEGEDDIEWEMDEFSEACGAANTLVVERDRMGNARRARLMNTDAAAAVGVLGEAIGIGGGGGAESLRGKRIMLVGAGGVARAIGAGAMAAGASVAVASRRLEQGQSVTEDLAKAEPLTRLGGSIEACGMDAIAQMRCDAIVNCTPVGMSGGPAPGASPISVELLRKGSPDVVVMETVYTPLNTPLLEQASLAGLRTIDGLAMFVRQAGEQFKAWTGSTCVPLRLFERLCREELAARERGGGV